MSDIQDLQGRILSAMDRIGFGIDALVERAAVAPDAGLAEALEEERLANAQLEERLRAVHSRHEDELAALRAELDRGAEVEALKAELGSLNEVMAQLETDNARLRQANDQLRASNGALREANQEGVGEPHLINQAMLAELEGMRADRAAEAAHAAAILSRLEPLLKAEGKGV